MLKTRVIPCLTVKDLRLVKSVRFAEHRNIGNIIAAVRVFNGRDVDEMAFLDLDASVSGLKTELLRDAAKECFMPLAIGGGIRTLVDVQTALNAGADKVIVDSAALARPELIDEASSRYGCQCVVVSIDARKVGDGYEVFGDSGRTATGRTPDAWAAEAERRGAGEILLTSIDRDGTMEGYDIELVSRVTSAVHIPVIACGGAGSLDHFVQAVREGGASAVAAASIFQYTQVTPANVKDFLRANGIDTRI
ncbi:MAG: imidazole glycerol phosphate synthase cyclase subunit [Patescibacteria group bacterium]